MSKWPASWRIIVYLLLVVCGGLAGCVPTADSPLDEEKDPNFVDGRNHVTMRDYKGAIECFERAIQANPNNASAHFEVAVLYEQQANDPEAALYHYKRHLQLRPKSDRTEIIQLHVRSCKLEIAKTVTFGVVTREVHQDLARMTNEVLVMKQQNDALRAQIAAKPMVITQWMQLRVTNYVQVPARVTNTPPATSNVATAVTNTYRPPAPVTNVVRRPDQKTGANVTAATRSLEARAPATTARAPRTYVVRSGDTLTEIARRNNISIERLRSANPSTLHSTLRAGQTLNIP